MPRNHSYADFLTEQRSKERLKDAVFVKCSDCGSPATHPSGLCRDCYQAKVEEEED